MSDPHPPDRLFHLSGYRLVLRHNDFPTPASVLETDGPRLADLHSCRSEIVKLVQAGHPDVMLALFVPRQQFDWQVAGIVSDPPLRILSASSMRPGGYSTESVLSLRYRVDDDGSQERAAWITLRDALRQNFQPRVNNMSRSSIVSSC